MASYQVTSPLVIAHRKGGTSVHLYEGALLPDDIDEKQLEQLVESKMVAEAGAPESEKQAAKKPARTSTSEE